MVVSRPSPRTLANTALAVLVVGAAIAAVAQAAGSRAARERAERGRPIEAQTEGYVSSRQCRACHLGQYRSWSRSYHPTMTTQATPEHVLAEFSGQVLRDGPFAYRLSREGKRFFVQDVAEQAGPEHAKKPLGLVTGSHHMQVYWYETGETRKLGQLPFAWLKPERRFIPRRSAFLRPPGEPRPNEGGRWNTSCIACHTTHGQPRADENGSFDTRVAELGIACEACHGPGRQHVARNTSPLLRYAGHFADGVDQRIVNPKSLSHQRASEICSQCHGIWQHKGQAEFDRWAKRGFRYRPGTDPEESLWLLQPSYAAKDRRVAEVLRREPAYVAGQFWPDGTARVSGREFNGMIDSGCYTRGELSCLSCHDMHQRRGDPRPPAVWADDQLGVGMDGDRACLQCHDAKKSNPSAHTRHVASSPGSRCYNCHMPHTSYGLLKAMRSHRIDSPNVTTELGSGRPNACNLCHLDQTLAWSAQHLQSWYGTPAPELGDDQRAIADSVLLALRGDAAQRALIAWAMGWPPAQQASGQGWMAPVLGALLEDPYDAVRYIAERSLRNLGEPVPAGYDFTVPPHTRKPVVLAARAASTTPPPASVPLSPAGKLEQDVANRLLGQRDQRPIHLLE